MKTGGFRNIAIGVDTEGISRFRKLNQNSDKYFLDKIYTPKELDYSFSKKNFAQHLAARYAAKEAVAKALSKFSPINITPLIYKEIEIYNNSKGMPMVKLRNGNLRKFRALVSLSHSGESAVAFAIAILHSKKNNI